MITKKMKVVAVIPVHGRIPLVKHTIERLLKKNGCAHVVCAGWTDEEAEVCTDAGAIFIRKENKPLSDKWNACFEIAGQLGADAVMFMGSSDWASDNWINVVEQYLPRYDMVGQAGCYLLDISQKQGYRVLNWKGYGPGRRQNEPIGIGRVLSSRILDLMDWKPFDDGLMSSLDWSMYNRVLALRGKIAIVPPGEIKSMAISTDRWENMHKFEDHWSNKIPSEKVVDHGFLLQFPEAFEIFNV